MAKKTTKSSGGTSSTKTNVKRVAKAVTKYDTSKSVKDNSEAIGGIVAATATSAARSKNKKQKTFFIVLLVIVLIAIVGVMVYGYYQGWFDTLLGKKPGGNGGNGGGGGTGGVADMSIHFMMLGNQNTGDSVYIKAGDVDILIDAGSRSNSAPVITDYINQYCDDGILEYVIVTHAHQDHIEGFVSTSTTKGIFESFQCKTIIQFARTDISETTGAGNRSTYGKYIDARNEQVAKYGTNVYTAQECIDNSNDIPKLFEIADGITMEILDQRFYRDKTSDENNYSVCVLFTHGDNHYLFTGDLEEAGEASLVALNPDLPEVELYKGGHHGSYTAGSLVLLEKIKPKTICICCCAGNVEYLTGATYDKQNLAHSFPAQEFIDRIAPYTDDVYVTTRGFIKDNGTKWVNDGFEPMNGNINFSCINGVINISCSNNNTKLKDTTWFANNRTCPEAWKNQ